MDDYKMLINHIMYILRTHCVPNIANFASIYYHYIVIVMNNLSSSQ